MQKHFPYDSGHHFSESVFHGSQQDGNRLLSSKGFQGHTSLGDVRFSSAFWKIHNIFYRKAF